MELNVVLLKDHGDGPIEVHAAGCPDLPEAIERRSHVMILRGVTLEHLALVLEGRGVIYQCLPMDVALLCTAPKGMPS